MSFARLRTFARDGSGSSFVLHHTEGPLTKARILCVSRRSGGAGGGEMGETEPHHRHTCKPHHQAGDGFDTSVLADVDLAPSPSFVPSLSGGAGGGRSAAAAAPLSHPSCCDATRISGTFALAVGYSGGEVRVNDLSEVGWSSVCLPPSVVPSSAGATVCGSAPTATEHHHHHPVGGVSALRWNPFFAGQLLAGYSNSGGTVSLFSAPSATTICTRTLRPDGMSASVVAAEWVPSLRSNSSSNSNCSNNNTTTPSFLSPSHAAVSVRVPSSSTSTGGGHGTRQQQHHAASSSVSVGNSANAAGFQVYVVDFRSASACDSLRLGHHGNPSGLNCNNNNNKGGDGDRTSARASQVGGPTPSDGGGGSSGAGHTLVAASGLAFHPHLPLLATYGNAYLSGRSHNHPMHHGGTPASAAAVCDEDPLLAPLIQIWDLRHAAHPVATYSGLAPSSSYLSAATTSHHLSTAAGVGSGGGSSSAVLKHRDQGAGVWDLVWAQQHQEEEEGEGNDNDDDLLLHGYSPIALFGPQPFTTYSREHGDSNVDGDGVAKGMGMIGMMEGDLPIGTSTISVFDTRAVAAHTAKADQHSLSDDEGGQGGGIRLYSTNNNHHNATAPTVHLAGLKGGAHHHHQHASPQQAASRAASVLLAAGGGGGGGSALRISSSQHVGQPVTGMAPLGGGNFLCQSLQGFLSVVSANATTGTANSSSKTIAAAAAAGVESAKQHATIPISSSSSLSSSALYINRADRGFNVNLAQCGKVLVQELLLLSAAASQPPDDAEGVGGSSNSGVGIHATAAWAVLMAFLHTYRLRHQQQQQQQQANEEPTPTTTAMAPHLLEAWAAENGDDADDDPHAPHAKFIAGPATTKGLLLSTQEVCERSDASSKDLDEFACLKQALGWPSSDAAGEEDDEEAAAVPWLSTACNTARAAFIALVSSIGANDRDRNKACCSTLLKQYAEGQTAMGQANGGSSARQQQQQQQRQMMTALLAFIVDATPASTLLGGSGGGDGGGGDAVSYNAATLSQIRSSLSVSAVGGGGDDNDNDGAATYLLLIADLLAGHSIETILSFVAGGGEGGSSAPSPHYSSLLAHASSLGTSVIVFDLILATMVIQHVKRRQQSSKEPTASSSSSSLASTLTQFVAAFAQRQGSHSSAALVAPLLLLLEGVDGRSIGLLGSGLVVGGVTADPLTLQALVAVYASAGTAYALKAAEEEREKDSGSRRNGDKKKSSGSSKSKSGERDGGEAASSSAAAAAGDTVDAAKAPLSAWRQWHEQYRALLDAAGEILVRSEYDLSLRLWYDFGLVQDRTGAIVAGPSTVDVEFTHACEAPLRTSAMAHNAGGRGGGGSGGAGDGSQRGGGGKGDGGGGGGGSGTSGASATTPKVPMSVLSTNYAVVRADHPHHHHHGDAQQQQQQPHLCQFPMPKCGVCGLNAERLLPSALMDPSEWFAWCTSCGHGGHAGHLDSWFDRHELCPFPLCPCNCRQQQQQQQNNSNMTIGGDIFLAMGRTTITDAITHAGTSPQLAPPHGQHPFFPSHNTNNNTTTVSGANSVSSGHNNLTSAAAAAAGRPPMSTTPRYYHYSTQSSSGAPVVMGGGNNNNSLVGNATLSAAALSSTAGSSMWGDVAYHFTDYPQMAAQQQHRRN